MSEAPEAFEEGKSARGQNGRPDSGIGVSGPQEQSNTPFFTRWNFTVEIPDDSPEDVREPSPGTTGGRHSMKMHLDLSLHRIHVAAGKTPYGKTDIRMLPEIIREARSKEIHFLGSQGDDIETHLFRSREGQSMPAPHFFHVPGRMNEPGHDGCSSG